MRIMITGGGTGGHTSPAVAIIEELRHRDPRLLLQWVGRTGNIEERVSATVNVPFRGLPVEGWPRAKKVRKLWVALKLLFCMVRAFFYLRRFRPDAVIGVGGYVSLPLMWVAQRMGINTLIHEQNKRLGMANRILAPRASRIFLSYEDTIGHYPKAHAQVVGNPVRAGFTAPPQQQEARERFGLRHTIPVILVSGGSQGATTLNQAVTEMLPLLQPGELQLLWMTGKSGYEPARILAEEYDGQVQVFPFIEDMAGACAAADIIVSRAGASSTAELAMLGKPAILVPYPFATDNHQEQNAAAFVEAGAAVMILDKECTGERILREIRNILDNSQKQGIMTKGSLRLAKPAAAEHIGEAVMALVFQEEKI